MRAEIQAELAQEFNAQLAAHGIDPQGCQGLTPAQYLVCADGLRKRRAEAVEAMGDRDRERELYMRSTIKWHVDKVTNAGVMPADGSDHRHPAVHGSMRSCSDSEGDRLANDDAIKNFYSPLARGNTPRPSQEEDC